ncbi:prolyl-tRNA editing enzyme YbaK/EbsC (Cys-tRNA(Pro) deacylase) [Propionicimonas paludicola]|uniref:Prolyl-tRNA editing enzyme YbaK/EbsC (Cys-tRNA(Pro) deacylase) n=1 Tax=Propionicimonas paludicola TaxID=185243 RepID=A0A2A9CW42_9ACTN|nr:YbaK/EbsC family protein [Propionicimonas paludicola]PFG18351.1 prolyl-tRNA editing enzyme YbaK/EbsC (Cys-tRNA(Pro) deacylase) [Propionicimonas paludicola]
MFARLKPQPAIDRPDLLPPAVIAAVRAYLPEALVFEIDPAHSDTETLCAVYDLPMDVMGNAVLVSGRRDGTERRACCLTLAHRRVDVNGLVKRRLDVRKASFAPMEVAVAESGMEYGGITPVGLPESWPIWLDAAVADSPVVCIGAGIRAAKLVVPGPALVTLPGAERIEGLARAI